MTRRLPHAPPNASHERRGAPPRATPLLCGALLVVAAATGTAGCRDRRAATPPAPATASGTPDAAAPADPNALLDELIGQHRADSAAASPVDATWLGLHAADDKLDDTSAAARTREAARLQHVIERAEAIPATALDATHRLDQALLQRHARLALFEITELRPLEHNPIRYVSLASSGIYELLASEFDPLPERLRSVVGRLGKVRPLFDEARKNLSNPPELTTRRAIELAQSTRAFLADTLPRVFSAVGDDRLIADFRIAQGEALRAFDDLVNFLTNDLLRRSKGDVAFGRDRLLAWIKLRESLDTPPEVLLAQLVAASDRELKVAEKRFEEAGRQAAPGKTTAETLRLLDEDHPGADQVLPATQQAVDQLYAFVRQHKLLPLPPSPPQVRAMPPYLWGYALVETARPFDARGDHALYVDPVNPTWDTKAKEEHLRAFGRAQLALFAIHEPLAHVVQADALRRASSVMQKVTAGPAFGEGFPRYLEQRLLDGGLGEGDAKLRFAQRREVLLSMCRMVGALKLHALGGRVDDVARLFGDAGGLEGSVARREAERVAVDPMVLDEALGMLALLRLREQAAAERGEEWSEGTFHDQLLAHGAPPIGTLRRLLLKTDAGPLL